MQTISEAAKECAFCAIGNENHFTHEQIFKYGVAYATRWISILEEMPKDMTVVLVKNNSDNPIRSLALFSKCVFSCDFSALEHKDVSHWRLIDFP